MSDGGKGSAPRPFSVDQDTFASNWDRTFSRARQRGGTAFAHLYGTARWQAVRARQLAKEPLCWRCARRGLVVEAKVCNHTNGHPEGETEAQFWGGPFDSQCTSCHSGETAREERGKPIVPVGVDGWPVADARRT